MTRNDNLTTDISFKQLSPVRFFLPSVTDHYDVRVFLIQLSGDLERKDRANAVALKLKKTFKHNSVFRIVHIVISKHDDVKHCNVQHYSG